MNIKNNNGISLVYKLFSYTLYVQFLFFETFFWFECGLPWLLKNPPAMQETWVWSLGQEDPLGEGMATHSTIFPGKSHGQRNLVGTANGAAKSWTWLTDFFNFGICGKLLNAEIRTFILSFIYLWCRQFLKSLLNFLQYYFCFMFWFFGHKTCGIFPWRSYPLIPWRQE